MPKRYWYLAVLAIAHSLLVLPAHATDMICHGTFWEPQDPPAAGQPASDVSMERLLSVVVVSADTPSPSVDVVIESVAHDTRGGSSSTLAKLAPIGPRTPGYRSSLESDGGTSARKRRVSVVASGQAPSFDALIDLDALAACKADHSGGFCRQIFVIRGVPELAGTDTSSVFAVDCAAL